MTMRGRAKRILCIEDDHETAQLLAEELTERGYEVALAPNGRAGLEAILASPPDLVLADVNLPAVSGFELLERLSSSRAGSERIPFVFLTALADRGSELKGWQLGADDYVTKPVDFDVLGARIAVRLARASRSEPRQEPCLAAREVEALTWVARGKTSAEIARILGLSKRTVDFHVDNARAKLGVVTRSQAVAKAASGQLISL
jgi:DNA-binding response OmpR family regulator